MISETNKDRTADLSGNIFFKEAGLPLCIHMHEYKSSTDKWHRHSDFYELVVVCSGSARNENEIRGELVSAGSVFLFPPDSRHRYTLIRNFCHYNVLFRPELLDVGPISMKSLPGYPMLFNFMFDKLDRCSILLSVDEAALSQLVSVMENIRNELSIRSVGWREAAYAEFIRMMVYLMRHCSSSEAVRGQNALQIGRIIRMMEENCAEQFSLESLASETNMSASSFRHHFVKITGLSPIEYLIKLRLRKAMWLLSTPCSISHVAAQAGFNEHNYFSRQFRRQLGMTPREFQRKCMKQQITVTDLIQKLLHADAG